MRSKYFLFFMMLLLSTTFLNAQDNSVKNTSDSLCFCREKVTLNGIPLKYNGMKQLLTQNPAPALEFKRYMRGASWGTLALFTGIAGGIVSLARIPKKDPFLNRYTITFFSGTVIGFTLLTTTRKHLKRSVQLYNEAISK
jgi:hypothetical protein